MKAVLDASGVTQILQAALDRPLWCQEPTRGTGRNPIVVDGTAIKALDGMVYLIHMRDGRIIAVSQFLALEAAELGESLIRYAAECQK